MKTERSFLLKTLIIFFCLMVTFILLVVMYQLLVSGNVDKSIDVLKLILGTISPLLNTKALWVDFFLGWLCHFQRNRIIGLLLSLVGGTHVFGLYSKFYEV